MSGFDGSSFAGAAPSYRKTGVGERGELATRSYNEWYADVTALLRGGRISLYKQGDPLPHYAWDFTSVESATARLESRYFKTTLLHAATTGGLANPGRSVDEFAERSWQRLGADDLRLGTI